MNALEQLIPAPLVAVTVPLTPPPTTVTQRPGAMRAAGPAAYAYVATLPAWMRMQIFDPAARPWQIPDTIQPEERLAILDVIADIGMMQPQQQQIAAALRARSNGTERSIVEETLGWVQRLGYVDDPPGDWYQGTLYTISDEARGHAGDCEDLSVELVTLLRLNGVLAWMWWVFQDGAALNHVTVRTKIDGEDVWTDPSIEGAEVGENPYHAAKRLKQLRRVGISPT